MENMIKVYEEVINQSDEVTREYKIWLNEMLDDEVISYENKIVIREKELPLVHVGELSSDCIKEYILEIYINERDEKRVKKLIESEIFKRFEKNEYANRKSHTNSNEEQLFEKSENDKTFEAYTTNVKKKVKRNKLLHIIGLVCSIASLVCAIEFKMNLSFCIILAAIGFILGCIGKSSRSIYGWKSF